MTTACLAKLFAVPRYQIALQHRSSRLGVSNPHVEASSPAIPSPNLRVSTSASNDQNHNVPREVIYKKSVERSGGFGRAYEDDRRRDVIHTTLTRNSAPFCIDLTVSLQGRLSHTFSPRAIHAATASASQNMPCSEVKKFQFLSFRFHVFYEEDKVFWAKGRFEMTTSLRRSP
jgi:hypothetical protein